VGRVPVSAAAEFPTTSATWLTQQLERDPPAARAHIMQRYFEPLCAYARASVLRALGEPAELVNAFFSARLSDDAYLARWAESGLPLRRWLANGLVIHARNEALARRRREERASSADPESLERRIAQVPSSETDALLALERSWAVRCVTEAHERVRVSLQAEGRAAWWELFRLHTVQGMPYAQASSVVGVSLANASSVHRQVVARLHDALHEILARDGVAPEDLDRELAAMQDLLR
jgi:DNA-directed RNA polymerase specialized sigma24 family protein